MEWMTEAVNMTSTSLLWGWQLGEQMSARSLRGDFGGGCTGGGLHTFGGGLAGGGGLGGGGELTDGGGLITGGGGLQT